MYRDVISNGANVNKKYNIIISVAPFRICRAEIIFAFLITILCIVYDILTKWFVQHNNILLQYILNLLSSNLREYRTTRTSYNFLVLIYNIFVLYTYLTLYYTSISH